MFDKISFTDSNSSNWKHQTYMLLIRSICIKFESKLLIWNSNSKNKLIIQASVRWKIWYAKRNNEKKLMQYKNSVYGIVKSYPRHHLEAVIIGVNFDDVNSLNFVDFLIKGNFPFHFKCC